MEPQDYYTLLDIASTANMATIRKAYKTMSLLYHPDKNGNSEAATKRFQEILNAYRVLSDEKKRATYDEWLKTRPNVQTFNSTFSPKQTFTFSKRNENTKNGDSDFADLFGAMGYSAPTSTNENSASSTTNSGGDGYAGFRFESQEDFADENCSMPPPNQRFTFSKERECAESDDSEFSDLFGSLGHSAPKSTSASN